MTDEEEIWVRAFCAATRNMHVEQASEASDWADVCLEDWEERFRGATPADRKNHQ